MFLPEELLIKTLSRLPVKSLMRFKCISKLWLSLISSRYLSNLFLEASSSRQHFFTCFKDSKEPSRWVVLASLAHESLDTSITLVDHLPTFPGQGSYFYSAFRGLVCFRFEDVVRICNLNTRQVVELPLIALQENKQNSDRNFDGLNSVVDKTRFTTKRYYLGHDPVHDEYKVCETRSRQVLVLGVGASWRNIQCHIPHHYPLQEGMTIKGVLYYPAFIDELSRVVIVSFDWTSEEFKMIELPNKAGIESLCSINTCMNYKGKISIFNYSVYMRRDTVHVWVLEDAATSQWSEKKTFVLPLSQMNISLGQYVVMNATSHSGKVWLLGNVYFTQNQSATPRFFIYDLERNEITQRIGISPLLYGAQLFPCMESSFHLLIFWDDIENIMYLET